MSVCVPQGKIAGSDSGREIVHVASKPTLRATDACSGNFERKQPPAQEDVDTGDCCPQPEGSVRADQSCHGSGACVALRFVNSSQRTTIRQPLGIYRMSIG